MVTTLKSRPNLYATLGLTPDADQQDIARAFARHMNLPHSVTDMAEIARAFETLRDPARRRAYDESIAPRPAPPPVAPVRDGWPFVASTRVTSVAMPQVGVAAKPAPADAGVPDQSSWTPEVDTVPVKPRVARHVPLREAVEARLREADGERIDWQRPAIVVGALFATVAVIGGGLGWYASNGIDAAQAEEAVAFPVPRPAASAETTPPVAGPTEAAGEVAQADPERPRRAAASQRRAPSPEPVLAKEERAADVPEIPSEQVAALASEVSETADSQSAAAAMPLPNATIARTIRRIGYPCAQVADTAAVDSATGVFKVTCESGHSYRAAPLRGRYHFRKW
jgi:hypothetical protein